MKIQSLGIGDECITVIFGDGEKERLGICPFPECGLYHAEELAVCDTTGKSIAEEVIHQEEVAMREKLAEEARIRYKNKYLYGWRDRLPTAILLFVVLSSFFSFFISSADRKIVVATGGVVVIVLTLLWTYCWEDWRRKRIKDKADAVFQRVLEGGEGGGGVKKSTPFKPLIY